MLTLFTNIVRVLLESNNDNYDQKEIITNKYEIDLSPKIFYQGLFNKQNKGKGTVDLIAYKSGRYDDHIEHGFSTGHTYIPESHNKIATYSGEWGNLEFDGIGELKIHQDTVIKGRDIRFPTIGLWGQSTFGGMGYKGTFKNNLFHASGRIFDQDNNVIYNGQFNQGRFHGEGKVYYKNRLIFEGQFNEGEIEGFGRAFREDGETFYEGFWCKNMFHGEGKLSLRNGFSYKGLFINNEFIIDNKIYSNRWNWDLSVNYLTEFEKCICIIYEGDIEDNKRNGFGKWVEVEDLSSTVGAKIRYEGEWKNNKKHGKGVSYDYRGRIISEGLWKDDLIYNGYQNSYSDVNKNSEGKIPCTKNYYENGQYKYYRTEFTNSI